ncbi:MAG: T9SS type A sorting domain-containing protein [Bacteroidota bacterium]
MNRYLMFVFVLFFCPLFILGQQRISTITSSNWEGAWWKGNVNQGSWFPSSDTLAVFSIDDYSWGEVRTLDTASLGDSIRISAQILVNSGGVNGDAAYFCIGNQWIFYGGGNDYGITFYNGKVLFTEKGVFKDSIGTYIVGELINFTLILNQDGSLRVRGAKFSGLYTPINPVQGLKWMFASENSTSHQGFLLKSVTPSLSNLHWEGAWWKGNVNQGSWFPLFDTLAVFSIDNYSWGEVRTLDTASLGDSIQISAQILVNSGGVNGDAAYFCVGNQWIFYGGGNDYGIAFYNGKVLFTEKGIFKDSIGIYKVGELINFTLILNHDGTLRARGAKFSGLYTPSNPVQNCKWMFASENSKSHQGFFLKSIFPFPPGPLSVTDAGVSVPNRSSLSQNYPNPFNPTTTISYALPQSAHVTLEVYNTLGERVALLMDEQEQAGYHNVEFHTTGLASGVYFYRISAGSFMDIKKLILLK